jgi:adenylate cyclase
MAVEIERKFLVAGDGWRAGSVASRQLSQFYLSRDGRSSVRVRIEGEVGAWLTIKSAGGGMARAEFEYRIPVADAQAMRPLAQGAIVEKVRHIVPFAGHKWEVDVFAGDNEGLVVAEVELASADQAPALPEWLGAEVTADHRYYNASLAQRPFRSW